VSSSTVALEAAKARRAWASVRCTDAGFRLVTLLQAATIAVKLGYLTTPTKYAFQAMNSVCTAHTCEYYCATNCTRDCPVTLPHRCCCDVWGGQLEPWTQWLVVISALLTNGVLTTLVFSTINGAFRRGSALRCPRLIMACMLVVSVVPLASLAIATISAAFPLDAADPCLDLDRFGEPPALSFVIFGGVPTVLLVVANECGRYLDSLQSAAGYGSAQLTHCRIGLFAFPAFFVSCVWMMARSSSGLIAPCLDLLGGYGTIYGTIFFVFMVMNSIAAMCSIILIFAVPFAQRQFF